MINNDALLLDNALFPAASALIRNAKKEIFISAFKIEPEGNPKKIKISAFYRALELAADKGVRVKVLLNKIWGKSTISMMNTIAAAQLKKKSVHVRTLDRGRTVHAKILIADDTGLIIGSHNWSSRSLNKNFETSLLVRNPDIINQTKKVFISLWDTAKIF